MKNNKQDAQIVLENGEVRIVSVRNTKTEGKVYIEFVEGMLNPESGLNVLAELNSTDDRFKPSVSVRHAWISVGREDAKKLGITEEILSGLKGTEETALDILSPQLKGFDLCIELMDSTTADEYEAANPQKKAKQYIDKNGTPRYFVTDKGELIFQKSRIVTKDARKHKIIQSAARLTWEEVEMAQEIAVASGIKLNG